MFRVYGFGFRVVGCVVVRGLVFGGQKSFSVGIPIKYSFWLKRFFLASFFWCSSGLWST